MYTQQPSGRQLRRDSADKVIAGVCSGIAEYYEINLFFIRLSFLFLACFSGLGIFIYFLLILIIPGKSKHSSPGYTPQPGVVINPQPGMTTNPTRKNVLTWFFGCIVTGVAVIAGFLKDVDTIWAFLENLLR
jgi:phage shock protein C